MSTELLIQEPFNADLIFNDEKKADEVIAKVEKLAKEAVGTTDATTAEGRTTLRAVAHKVTKSKTFVEAERKAYTADLVKKKRSVDQIGGKIWDGLEKVHEDIRRPLTEWELKEAARIAAHDAAFAYIERARSFQEEPTAIGVKARILDVRQLMQREWEEFGPRAKEVFATTSDALAIALAAAEKREKDAAELAALRAEKEARDLAAAAEAARLEEERRARERKEREERLAAAAAEHARVQAEQAAAMERQQRARQANLEHRSEVNRAVHSAIADALRPVCYGTGINTDIVEALAHDVVVAIAKGQIPNVTIDY